MGDAFFGVVETLLVTVGVEPVESPDKYLKDKPEAGHEGDEADECGDEFGEICKSTHIRSSVS